MHHLLITIGSHGDTHGDPDAKVWDASNGKLVKNLPVGGFCAVGFSPDGKWLMTTGGGCRLWVVETWEEPLDPASQRPLSLVMRCHPVRPDNFDQVAS